MIPFDPSGPSKGGGIYGLPHTPDSARVVLIPVPWEPTTSYRKGTAGGPAAILEASQQVDLFDRETGRPYEAGIAMLAASPDVVRMNREACELAQPVIDAGGAGDDPELRRRLTRTNELCLALDDEVTRAANQWLEQGKLVGVVGGDHATPFGLIRALAARHPGMGVLHIDAHADLRVSYEGFERSHASIMHNVHELLPGVAKIVQVAIRDLSEEENAFIERSERIEAFFEADLAKRDVGGIRFADTAIAIAKSLPELVYVSFDIDGLDPTLCPNTGTPVPGGLSFREATAILAAVVATGKRIVGFDLNEVAGAREGTDAEWDAIVGARVLYKLIGFALMSERN